MVYFESANYAGYGEHCLVWASSEDEARSEASDYAEEFYYEQDEAKFLEEHECENTDMWATIIYTAPLAKFPNVQEYIKHPIQSTFYPIVNDPTVH